MRGKYLWISVSVDIIYDICKKKTDIQRNCNATDTAADSWSLQDQAAFRYSEYPKPRLNTWKSGLAYTRIWKGWRIVEVRTTTTPWAWHRLRIRRPLPFDIRSQKLVAAYITYKLFFPSRHQILFLLRAKICFFFSYPPNFCLFLPIFTKDLD